MESKTGVHVRWLLLGPIEQTTDRAIRLPCPTDDLIRLVATGSDGNDRSELSRLLRLNPALLLIALSCFHQKQGSTPGSTTDWVNWCRDNLLRSMFHGNSVCSVDEGLAENRKFRDRKKVNAFFSKFVRARSNKKLRKSLVEFLESYCDVDEREGRRIVKALVGKRIRADQLKCKRIRHSSTCAPLVKNWSRRRRTTFDLQALFSLAVASLESGREFESRLTLEKLAAMKQLAYGASHEINNPLANIATRAQTMLAVEADHEKRNKLSVIYEQAIRAHEMISDMMLFAHPPALKPNLVSLRLLISRILKEMNPLFSSAPGIEIRVIVGAGVDQVVVDPTQFSVAIKNLVQNAFESLASPPNSNSQPNHRIKIRVTKSKQNQLEISVWDSGEPVTEDVARHMFDPFYSGREAGRGLGFGLSKAWTIAKLHQGSLKFDDRSEAGNRFVLIVPNAIGNATMRQTAELSICKNQPGVGEEAA